jgi:hypothetical protein
MGAKTINLGVGGQRSGDIAVRMNAYAGQSQQTFAEGFTIPTRGTVTVTWGDPLHNPAFFVIAPNPSYPSGVPIATSSGGRSYTLNCLNTSARANTANCKPAAYPASPVDVPSGAAWTAVVGSWLNGLNLIRAGRNNYQDCSSAPIMVSNCQVAADIAAMVAAASGPGRGYRVLSVQNGDYYPVEYAGHPAYAKILAINAWEAETYGAPGYTPGTPPYYSGSFVDVRANLVAATCAQSDAVDQYACTNDFPGIHVRASATTHGQLAAGIDSTDTAFAYAGGITTLARIDSEFIQVQAIGPGQVSKAQRGFAGSTPASHSNGAPFTLWDNLHESPLGSGLDAAIVGESIRHGPVTGTPVPAGC